MLFYASIIELADLIADSGVHRHVSVFEYDILLPERIQSKNQGVFKKYKQYGFSRSWLLSFKKWLFKKIPPQYVVIHVILKKQFQFWDVAGVNHGEDIFYMFGVPLVGSNLTTYTHADIEVSKVEMTLYSNFVKSE
jgi:hypothetical protein